MEAVAKMNHGKTIQEKSYETQHVCRVKVLTRKYTCQLVDGFFVVSSPFHVHEKQGCISSELWKEIRIFNQTVGVYWFIGVS